MPEQMSASDSHVRVNLDSGGCAQGAEVKVFTQHSPVRISVVHPVVPRVAQAAEHVRMNEGASHPASVALDGGVPGGSHVDHLSRRVFRFQVVVEVLGAVRFVDPADARRPGIPAVRAPVRVVPEADRFLVFQEMVRRGEAW